MISYLVGEGGTDRNPLLQYRTAFDLVAGYVSLLLAMILVVMFHNSLIGSSAASNWLLALMAIYLVGEILSRVYVPIKLAALLLYGFGLCAYVGFAHGRDALQSAVNLGFEKFIVAAVVSAPVVLYFSTQKGTYHHHAALVACGFFTFLTWLAILMARGYWEKIDSSGQLLFCALFAISIAMLMTPRLVESIFLRVGWPVASVTYLAIKESDGNFDHVVDTLLGFISLGGTIVIMSVLLVIAWKKVGPGSLRKGDAS